MKEKLEHRVDDGQSLAFLQDRYRDFLEGVLIEEENGEATDETPANAAE